MYVHRQFTLAFNAFEFGSFRQTRLKLALVPPPKVSLFSSNATYAQQSLTGCRASVASGGGVGVDRRLSASSSSSSSSAHYDVVPSASSSSAEFAPLSSNNLAWGVAAASVAISLVGYMHANRELFGNDLMCNRGCYARGYHSSTALCESSSMVTTTTTKTNLMVPKLIPSLTWHNNGQVIMLHPKTKAL